ncbi:hypothetical protein BGZ59_002684, partial [Podila verticillata]
WPNLGDSVSVQAGPSEDDSSLRTVLRLACCFAILDDRSLLVGLEDGAMRDLASIWVTQSKALMQSTSG